MSQQTVCNLLFVKMLDAAGKAGTHAGLGEQMPVGMGQCETGQGMTWQGRAGKGREGEGRKGKGREGV